MAKLGILQKLMAITNIELFFDSIAVQKDREGKHIAILHLQEPMPFVRGTQEVEFQGKMQAITASNVSEIKVHEEDMNDGFEFSDDSDTGHYKGSDLILDVSKNGQVWMKKTSFAAGASNFRAGQRTARIAKLFGELTPPPVNNTNPEGTKKLVDTGAKKP